MDRRRLVLAVTAFTLVCGGAAVVLGYNLLRSPTLQPIAFNHKLHVVDNGLECVTCHVYVTSQPFAGLPDLEKCLECHRDPLTDSPEEKKLRSAAAKRQQLVWRRLYEVPDHVYYSHRLHVVAGKLECARCHGPIQSTTSPPAHALNELTMEFCIGCHEKAGVTTDCIACHK
ncbi:MAG: hypothetical protein HY900_17495 [Deltaproteobacteria bacterium]|nr:hypothetical protein [Deltaproteobacteria bacterium]